jgi:hypothetical protein
MRSRVARKCGYGAEAAALREEEAQWRRCLEEARREIECLLMGQPYVWRNGGER